VILVHVATAVWQWHEGYEGIWGALLLPRSARFRVAAGGQFAPLVQDGEVWRLCTSALLHGDALHLLVNAVALGTLGRLLEPWVGGLRFLSWFALGGLAGAALCQAAGIVQSDGSSGGAFALLTAAAVLATRYRRQLAQEDRRLGLLLWMFLGGNLVLTFVLPFIAAPGHVGGLLVGGILGLFWRDGPRKVADGAHAAWLLLFVATCGIGWGL
jgi:membrane associated rhomboid family serine protease